MSQKPLLELTPTWFAQPEINSGEPVALQFDCPVCPRGDHRLFVPFVDHVWNPRREIWTKTGDSFETLSMTPSIYYRNSPCAFHGYVTNGMVTW